MLNLLNDNVVGLILGLVLVILIWRLYESYFKRSEENLTEHCKTTAVSNLKQIGELKARGALFLIIALLSPLTFILLNSTNNDVGPAGIAPTVIFMVVAFFQFVVCLLFSLVSYFESRKLKKRYINYE